MYKCRVNQIVIYLIYIFFGIWLFMKCDFESIYVLEYITLLISYFIVGGIVVLLVFSHRADIFEPIYLTLVLLIGLFSVAPICLTAAGTDTLYGKNFMGGCIKTTIIYVFCSISLCFGYYQKVYSFEVGQTNLEEKLNNKKILLQVMYGIWGICFFIGISFETLALGRSFMYILTLGGMGINDMGTATISSVNFLLNFSYSCILPWLYIMFLEKNSIKKGIVTYCMVMLYIVCGWRNVIIIVALSYITVYYINKNKRPSKKGIIMCLIVGVIFLGALGSARYGLRNGQRTKINLLDTNSILFALESNFNLYQPFYAIVKTIPAKFGYSWGKGMIFDTLITFVPRAIWPQKPLARDFALLEAIRLSTSDTVIDGAAMAVPSIAEFYVDFGIIGSIILCFFAGKILQECTKLYKRSTHTFHTLALYGVIFGVLDVLVMRGYMPNNFYYVIFLIWPYWIAKRVEAKGKLF